MPISALQYRVTAGAYQNKLHNSFRMNSIEQTRGINSDHSAIPDEIHLLGRSISRVVNSHEQLSRSSYQTTNPRQGIAAPLLMLLTEVQLTYTPVVATSPTTVSESEMKPSMSENVEQSANSNHFWETIQEASVLPAAGYQDKEKKLPIKNRSSRYAVFKQKTTTPPPEPDDVKTVKLDSSCFEKRQNLSRPDVFRQIGETLRNPVSELAKESQVIHYYNNNYGCPTPEERVNLLSITSKVDKTISAITALLPGSQPLVVTQRLGGALFRMIADSIDNKQLNTDDLFEVNDQLITLGKSIVATSPKDSKGQTIEGQLRVPEGLSFKNNKLSVNIKGTDREFIIKNGRYFTNIDGKHRRISYSLKNKQWVRTPKYIKTSGEKVYFPFRIGKLLNGSIDKKTLVSISPNQHGIYTVTSQTSAGSFHAIKIGYEFYRYIPENGRSASLSGVIKTDSADIKVSRFGKRYFIVNEKKKLSVNYSPCRLGRSPGSSCLHFSDGLISKLNENRNNGVPERRIRGIKPSETNPGLYESEKGTLYLKYDNVYFKLISSQGWIDEPQFMVTGKKIFGSKKITPVCFSRERGFNYINTPLENMMESVGMPEKVAMSHIKNQSKIQPFVIGTGSLSEVYDIGDGFVSKIYKSRINKTHKSRLSSAKKNAEGFNRYYGKGSGTVRVTPYKDGSATVSVKLKKIDGYVLSSIKDLSNPVLLEEIETAIKTSKPSEKLSSLLQSYGISHNDINKGNIIYNNGEFFVIDFDSADFLPKGEIVSKSKTNTMRNSFDRIFNEILREIGNRRKEH